MTVPCHYSWLAVFFFSVGIVEARFIDVTQTTGLNYEQVVPSNQLPLTFTYNLHPSNRYRLLIVL